MSNLSKLSVFAALAVLGLELILRWSVRAALEPGQTLPLMGKFYLTNATNVNSIRGLGLSSVTWLCLALVICLLFVAAFQSLTRAPPLQGNRFVYIGCIASFLLVAVVVSNLVEAMLLGGVTDYLALVDLSTGRAHVINLGDIILFLSLLAVVVTAIGAGASLLATTTKPIA
jgi:hypothetical protein